MNAKDFYFGIEKGQDYLDKDDDGNSVIETDSSTFYVVPKDRWDSTGYLDDGVGRLVNSTLFPLGFRESSEAMYEYDGPDKEGRQKLINLGFVETEISFGD